jgi:hypothetical protein
MGSKGQKKFNLLSDSLTWSPKLHGAGNLKVLVPIDWILMLSLLSSYKRVCVQVSLRFTSLPCFNTSQRITEPELV